MQSNNIRVPSTFADIQPISHDMGKINLMLKDRNKGELATLKAVNSLAREPYHTLKKQQNKWKTFKSLAIYASLIPLLITLLIYYISPMLTQKQFEMNDARVWGMGALMASVAFAVAILIDLGRANILDKSNNTKNAYMLYFFMSASSILFSTVGMIAIADFYASSESTSTTQTIATAKSFMVAHASMASNRSLSDIDAEEMRLTQLMHAKKSGYHPKDLKRDVARLNEERKELKDYQSAKATVDGKRQLQNTDDSSNWLFNTYARILESNTATAGIVIGLLINFLSEAMALIAHVRLIKLNARLEVTEQQWSTATMVANEAMIVADSEISALNHLDYFAHTFKMPFNILHDYQNQNKRYGEFVSDNDSQQAS
ncbi:MAG: hypothetical protein KAG86_06765, partial [Gammaproteobacteria bacterium]|nr:hypothetical protein [Gammaproteobacteria bacterium]